MKTKSLKTIVRDSYMKLVAEFPLRPIRSEVEYDRAVAVVDRLAVRGEGDLDAGETDYLDALSVFIEKYDDEHYPLEPGLVTGPAALRHLLDSSGMTQVELARLLGVGSAAASMIVAGQRPITADHARALGQRFKVSPALFL